MLLAEARLIVEERRSRVVLGIQGQASRDGVFQWVGGPPKAGQPATLAYNKNSGALRNAQVTTTLAGTMASAVLAMPCVQLFFMFNAADDVFWDPQ